MSLNSIKFELSDIASLFKNSLVDIDEKKQDVTRPALIAPAAANDAADCRWKYLGGNKKKTLIVVCYDNDIHLPDKQLSFLTKLLAACHMDLSDVAIINSHKQDPGQFNDIVNFFLPKSVLLFGIRPAEFGMPMNFPDFQVQPYKDVVFLSSPALERIEPDKDLKGKLWVCLKKIYNL